jgi:uncharacterized RDD family membrane protein YckC
MVVPLRAVGHVTIPTFHWSSAAQNGPVIRICSQCGALLLNESAQCSLCEASPADSRKTGEAAPVRTKAPNSDDGGFEWRREVSRRLEEYRARRGRPAPNDSQSGLPFHRQEKPLNVEEPPKRPRPKPLPRVRPTERLEICIQPELDFASLPGDRAHPQNPLVPVAKPIERRVAGFIDATFLGLTCAGFLGLFRSLGGQLSVGKIDAIVCVAVVSLIYALYFSLFTTLAGATPGMQIRGLTIVRLDGSLPDTRQLGWRSFGYILSGAALMLGFLWSFWDEDHFTWHDRISQTYITAASPVMPADAVEVPPGEIRSRRQMFAQR